MCCSRVCASTITKMRQLQTCVPFITAQDEHARAEGYGIVHADEQYIVPTDGAPIRGLIQDHVVAGVLMTKRDTFFTCAHT